MKRLLMATAAVIALAIAAPLATAQYTTPPPATAPYTTPVPDDPMTPQDESLSAQHDTTMNQPPPASSETSPPHPAATQPYPAEAYDTQTQTQTQTQAQTQTHDSQTGMGVNVATLASLEEHARDAGMDRLPMTPQEVCAPRDLMLTTGRRTSLSRDKEHQLINAADRASVCELQRIVIHSPTGRADEARRLLIDADVDSNLIEVQQADMGGLHVEMSFAGIATSSEYYAQLFSTQQLASYQPAGQPSAPGYQPSATYQPGATPQDIPDEGVWLGAQPPPTEPSSEMTEPGMSATSGEAVTEPELLDI